METGFYQEWRRRRKADPCSDFDFLQEEYEGTNTSAYLFLHGYCDTFAVELSKKYGYELEAIWDFENGLTHAYCVADLNGERAYIDIRGITTDPKSFLDDFEDCVCQADLETGYANITRYSTPQEYKADGWPMLVSEPVADARKFIAAYGDIYDISLLRKLSLDERICSAATSKAPASYSAGQAPAGKRQTEHQI